MLLNILTKIQWEKKNQIINKYHHKDGKKYELKPWHQYG